MAHVVRSHNLKVGRRAGRVRSYVRAHPEVDVWLLQEAHQYRRVLADIPGFRLHMPTGRAPCAILVRDTLDQEPLEPLRMERTWRRPRMPGQHPPRIFPPVDVEGIRYVSVHIPERRSWIVPARAECYARLAALLADGVPTLLGGDWNGKPSERGPGLPAALIEDHNLTVKPTGRIDFFAGQGVRIAGADVLEKFGSDHTAIQAEVSLKGADMGWRVATSLDVLLHELNAAAPHRSKASDGALGDASHASRDSDHNPWLIKDGVGIVRARDFTHDPASGLDCEDLADGLAERLALGDHYALRTGAYVIWNRRIISRDRINEGWRPYNGPNPHTKHLHLSVTTDPTGFDSTQVWDVLSRGDGMALSDTDKDWIRQTVAEAVASNRVDVGRENPWADDKVAEVVLNTLGRIEAKLTTLTQEARK